MKAEGLINYMEQTMKIEIWSDVICPWCYIGKRRFEQALEQFGHHENINVIWRSFELDRNAPPLYPGTLEERLASKYGVSRQERGSNECQRDCSRERDRAGISLGRCPLREHI